MPTKYQAYPEYKDSGVEWLGQVPSNWNIKKLKYICEVGTGDKDTVNAVEGGKYPFFVRSQTVERINSYEADCEAVLTAGDGVGVGKVFHHYTGKFDFHQRVYMLSNFSSVYGRFIFYYLSNNFYKVALEGNAKSTVDSLRLPQFLNFEFSLPDLVEQKQIAKFLDHETAKIDTLIEKQQQLIKLLKEKRQAVISHAVTKGLNPNAPMRDSGMPWLGEIPEHWERITFKYLLKKMVDNRGRTPPTYDTGIPLLEAKHIDGSIKYSSDEFDKFIDEEGHKNFIRDDVSKNDILFITVGTIGKTCLVPSSSNFVIAQNIVGLRVLDSCSPLFLLFWLRSMVARESMLATNKDSILDSIKISDFVQSRLYIPPICEQEKIAEFLDNKIIRIDDLIKKAGEVIDLMRERRTALISAAVTGRIDVRDV